MTRHKFPKGYTPWNKGLTKEVDNRLVRTAEYINSIKGEGNTFYGRKHAEETKIKIASRHYPKGKDHPFYGKHRWANKIHPMTGKHPKGPWLGKHRSEETKNKLRIANLGRHHTLESKQKMSVTRKENWKKAEFIEKWRKGMNKYKDNIVYPTKPEATLIEIMQENNISFDYTGDGRRWINKYNPDFINEKEKLIIEVFGDYWHNLPKIKNRDENRLRIYGENGYKTLVIWEHELTGRGGESLTIAQIVDKIRNTNKFNPIPEVSKEVK